MGGEFCSDTLVSAPDARAYFLLLREKKVAKEKATPGSAPGKPGSLRYSSGRASRMNSPAAQTMRSDCPRPACVAQRLSRGPERRLGSTCKREIDLLRSTAKKGQKSKRNPFSPGGFTGPLERCRATQGFADQGRALSEGQRPELRSPRETRVAQGTRQSRAPTQGRLFFAYFLLATQKKVMPPVNGGKQCFRKHSTTSQAALRTSTNTINHAKNPLQPSNYSTIISPFPDRPHPPVARLKDTK